MAEIGRWCGIKFEVKSGLVRGFTGLTIKGSVETTDQEYDTVKYVANKARKPTEVSLTVHLDARLGAEVRETAMNLVSYATFGAEDYFYIANRKLVPYKMKLVEASVNEIQMNAKGDWICCDVKMSMKQSSIIDGQGGGGGGSSGGGGGSGKVSVKTNPISAAMQKVSNAISTVKTKVVNTVKSAATTFKNVLTGKTSLASALTSAVKAGVSAVSIVTTVAKSASAAIKTTQKSNATAKITNIVKKTKK